MNINKTDRFMEKLLGKPRIKGDENPAGTKMLKRIKAKTLTIRNKGGIVSDAIRQIARDKNLAKLANQS